MCPSSTLRIEELSTLLEEFPKKSNPLSSTLWLSNASVPTLRPPHPRQAPLLSPHATLLRAHARTFLCSMMLLSPRNLSIALKSFRLTSIRARGKGFATIDLTSLKSTVHISCITQDPSDPFALSFADRLFFSNNISKTFLGSTVPSQHRKFCAISNRPHSPIATTTTIVSSQLLAHIFFNPYRLRVNDNRTFSRSYLRGLRSSSPNPGLRHMHGWDGWRGDRRGRLCLLLLQQKSVWDLRRCGSWRGQRMSAM